MSLLPLSGDPRTKGESVVGPVLALNSAVAFPCNERLQCNHSPREALGVGARDEADRVEPRDLLIGQPSGPALLPPTGDPSAEREAVVGLVVRQYASVTMLGDECFECRKSPIEGLGGWRPHEA